jgi:2-methylisocitrate lyase-like PEP mutase family enzyme
MTELRRRFRALIAAPDTLLMPGAHDALSARIIAREGFQAIVAGGYAALGTLFAEPDMGQGNMRDIADHYGRICGAVDVPVLVDADTGFGNALNVQHTVRLFERAGANALQLEDQTSPKRCGHLSGKDLIGTSEMVGKIRAAVDARATAETLIIARTDAIAVEGFERALERANLYREAGADVLFIEAPQTAEQLERIGRGIGGAPMLANMVEGGRTPLRSLAELEAMGFRLVITPGALVRAVAHMAQSFLGTLREDGSTARFRERMLDFQEINGLLGLPDLMAEGERYDGRAKPDAERSRKS